jgi:NTP pyrophosphatase (non-canonical NTP hydrolase)
MSENRETQESIGAWAVDTFGGPTLTPRHCIRLLEEIVELCLAVGSTPEEIDDAINSELHKATVRAIGFSAAIQQGYWLQPARPEPSKVPEEIADCQIVLFTVAHRAGIDLEAEVAEKMERNRARSWEVLGDGTGYHVKEGEDSQGS